MGVYYVFHGMLRSANSISSRGDYSRVASISLAQVRLLFESGVYFACSGAMFIRKRRLFSHIQYV